MSINKPILLLLCLALLAGCKPRKSEKAPENIQETAKRSISGHIRIGGAYALSPLVQKWADEFRQLYPAVQIEISKTGTGQGISDLIGNNSDLAMISRPLTDEEKESGIWVIPVAKDGVAPIINGNNPYLKRILRQGFSPDELQKIFLSEQPPTWAEMLDTSGNEKIVVYSRADESGAYGWEYFRKAFAGNY